VSLTLPATRRASRQPPRRRRVGAVDQPSRTMWVAASATALVMAVFSAFVVNVGDSVLSLHAGVTGQAWGLSGMGLGLAAALLTAGALADDLGHGRVLRWSAGMLAGASALGALAPSIAFLVAARVLQGVAGAGMLAAGLGAIGRAFPTGTRRTRATSVWGASVGAGVAAGPLGGAGLAAAAGWRSVFWAEMVAAAAVMAASATLARPPSGTRRALDLPGITTLGAGMTLLTAGFVQARQGWSDSATLVLLGAAVVMLGTFAAVELRSPRPMLDPRLLTQPGFLASASGALFTGLAVVGLMSYAPTVMQQALHISALGSATLLAAWSATSMVMALAAGSLPGRLPARTRLLIGLALAAVGEFGLTDLGTGTGWPRIAGALFITGIGSGLVNAALGRLAVESVPQARVGMGGGANNTARYLGGAAGVALTVSIASGSGGRALIGGWNNAALLSAALSLLGVAIVASCRSWRGAGPLRSDAGRPPGHVIRCTPTAGTDLGRTR
jgi:MFS family permease